MPDMDLSGWFTVVIGAFTVAASAGGLSAWFKANYAKTQIEYLQRNVTLRDDRIEILEQDNSKMSQDIELMKVRENSLNDKIKTLEGVVTGKEQLDHLQNSLDGYARENHDVHQSILRNQEKIFDILRDRVA